MSPYHARPRRRSRSRSGWKLRLLIALGMVAFSLISFYSTGQVNPITGEKQRVAMSAEQEIAMGLQAEPEMVQQYGGMVRDPASRRLVDQVGNRLLAALNEWVRQSGRNNPYVFKFHLLNDQRTINAFALPGGQVFITNALFSKLQTEGQLAGVLAHEIGHVLSRHGAQRLAKQKLTQMLTGAAGVAGGDVNSARMAQAVGQMVNLKYGRGDELEADKWSVLLTADAGYDPQAMLGVMEILDAAGGEGPPEMMSTHPKPRNREAYIRRVIKDVFPNGLPAHLDP